MPHLFSGDREASMGGCVGQETGGSDIWCPSHHGEGYLVMAEEVALLPKAGGQTGKGVHP